MSIVSGCSTIPRILNTKCTVKTWDCVFSHVSCNSHRNISQRQIPGWLNTWNVLVLIYLRSPDRVFRSQCIAMSGVFKNVRSTAHLEVSRSFCFGYILLSKISQYFKIVLCAVKVYIGTSGACIKIIVRTKNGHSLKLRKERNGQLNASSIFGHHRVLVFLHW